MALSEPRVLEANDLQSLLDAVAQAGYQAICPTEHEGAIEYAPVNSVAEFPLGLVDTSEAGTYRLEQSDTQTYFGYVTAAQSWKRFLYPPHEQLLNITASNGTPHFSSVTPDPPRYAFIGVRACELAAIAIQDRVFLNPTFPDPRYAARRDGLLIVAVECVRSGGTCFCTSMGTGPAVTEGADVVLTEVVRNGEHWFLLRTGSDVGAGLVAGLPTTEATTDDVADCAGLVAAAAASVGRSLDTSDVHDLLLENPDHRRWETTGKRCLACTSCTMVCPTCFCSTTEDGSSLGSATFTRQRRWDSCFSLDFSALHRHPVRSTVAARYRQWLTHKLAGWIDQFGMSGCVGCGRCITWCPVGIDITREVAEIRDDLEVSV